MVELLETKAMKIYNCSLCAALTVALLLTGCTQDIFQNGGEAESDSKTISFTAQTVDIQDDTRSTAAPEALPLTGDGLELWLMPSETPMVSEATRGTQINSVEELSNFGVSAYRHGAIPTEKTLNEYLTDNNLKPDFFYNLEATKITDTQKFKLTKDFFWPTDDDVLSFFAYAPYGDENVELSAATVDGPQSINFKVDTDVKKQVDLITAQASTKSHLNTSVAPSVALNFTHQLTGIRFVIGDQFLKGWIKSISLKGVYTQGTYTIGGGWTLDDSKKGNFTISYNLDKPVAGTPGEEVSASDEVFMMIPHTFAANDAATIEVVYNDKYTDYIVSAPLKGQTWKAGKTVTYAITSNKLTTLRIGQIQFATTPEGAPKRIWEAGDKIGMYVVGADGKKLKHKNVPVTYDGANWNIDHTTAEGTIYKLAGESFYFYYPYSDVSNGQPTGYPEQCPELKAEAPVFFQGVIDYSTIKEDQSTLANFKSSDLQVARAEDDGHASMIKATMLRQRGLAVIQLGSKQVPTTRTYNSTSSVQEGDSYSDSSAKSVIYASSVFSGNIPLQSGTKYYYYTKPGVATIFNSSSTVLDAWASAVSATLAAGETSSVLTPQSGRQFRYRAWKYVYEGKVATFTTHATGNYQLEVWGAQGAPAGNYSSAGDIVCGGKGGKAWGNRSINSGTQLYLAVGSQTTFNGGGNPPSSLSYNQHGKGPCGGGASHIAITNNRGELKNYKNYQSEVILVAGGGGASEWNGTGGNGGGTAGANGIVGTGKAIAAYGASSTAGGSSVYLHQSGHDALLKRDGQFGEGGWAVEGTSTSAYDGGGGGGGGWYGGGGTSWAGQGGGGSGHIGSGFIANTTGMSSGVQLGAGYILITSLFEY